VHTIEPSREKGDEKGKEQPPATYVLPEEDVHLKRETVDAKKKDKVRVARSACCLASKQVHFRGLGASRARRFRLRQANGRRRRACRFHRWPCHSQQHKKLCHPAMPTMKRGRRHRDGRRRRSHTGISRWCCPVDR
jgi:hypothetical protein